MGGRAFLEKKSNSYDMVQLNFKSMLLLSLKYFFVVNLFTGADLDTLMEHGRLMVLLSKVYQKKDNLEAAMQSLTKARDMQAR